VSKIQLFCIFGRLTLGVKWPGHKVDHLPPSKAEVKNVWSYTSTTPVHLMVYYLIKQDICLHGVVLS